MQNAQNKALLARVLLVVVLCSGFAACTNNGDSSANDNATVPSQSGPTGGNPSTKTKEQEVAELLKSYLQTDTRQNATYAPVRREVFYTADVATWSDITNALAAKYPATALTDKAPPANQCYTSMTATTIQYAFKVYRTTTYIDSSLGLTADVAKQVALIGEASWAAAQAVHGYPTEIQATPTIYICATKDTGGSGNGGTNNGSLGPSSVLVSIGSLDTSDLKAYAQLVAHEGAHLTSTYVRGVLAPGPSQAGRTVPAWIDEGYALYVGNQERYGTQREWDQWIASNNTAGRPTPEKVPGSGMVGGVLVTNYGYYPAFNEMLQHVFNNDPRQNVSTLYFALLRKQKALLAATPNTCSDPTTYGLTANEKCFKEAFDATGLKKQDGSALTLSDFNANYNSRISTELASVPTLTVKVQKPAASSGGSSSPSITIPILGITIPPASSGGGSGQPQSVAIDALVLMSGGTTPAQSETSPLIYDSSAIGTDGSAQLRTKEVVGGTYTLGYETVDSNGQPLQHCFHNATVLNDRDSRTLTLDQSQANCVAAQ